MGFISNRLNVVGTCLVERVRYGLPELVGTIGDEVLFVLDGVGRFQMAPSIIRRVLREQGSSIATILYDWQFGLVGEIWTDLMWYRRNRVMGAKLARKVLAVRREHPDATIHMVAYSGGVGIALFACAYLGGRAPIETLMLACPAVSPEYNLAPALRAVRRCYALVSPHDKWILGLATRIFGTTDRCFSTAAGCVGFRVPGDLSSGDRLLYARLHELRWSEELRCLGHPGGHTGWVSPAFLSRHLLPILRGEPLLTVSAVQV